MENKVFIKVNKQNKVNKTNVLFEDIFKIYSSSEDLIEEIGHISLVEFEDDYERKTFDCIEVVKRVMEVMPDVEVECLGQCDFMVEYSKPTKAKGGGAAYWLKVFAVCVISMVGAGYGIVAYNNDVSTIDIFDRVYEQLGATAYEDSKIMEVSYAIGLFVGIVTFFDHFAGHKITKSPTPIEVAMDKYNEDIVDYVIDNDKSK